MPSTLQDGKGAQPPVQYSPDTIQHEGATPLAAPMRRLRLPIDHRGRARRVRRGDESMGCVCTVAHSGLP
eukprot:3788461-Prymnesium_polylepis.2